MSSQGDLDGKLETLVKERDRVPFKTALYTVGLSLVTALSGFLLYIMQSVVAYLSPIN